MDIREILAKKRDGKKLEKSEIDYFVEGVCNEEFEDAQVGALLMAVCINGMDEEETFALTEAMAQSGETLDLSDIKGVKADKHSTGGVGDKISLIAGSIVASCGVVFAKMAGKSLGFTGGTIDKLASIPGMRTDLSTQEFKNAAAASGMAVMQQTDEIAKADKILYAMRNATETADNKGLIASSIMSKKLATGCENILLDVKFGSGSFNKTEAEARELAELMIGIGKKAGKNVAAVISSMEQPLGNAVGNSAEIVEVINTLRGKGPEDVTKLSIHISAHILMMAGKAQNLEDAVRKVEVAIESGTALDTFRSFIRNQGGSEDIVDDISLLPRPKYAIDIVAKTEGYVAKIDAKTVGEAIKLAGGGKAEGVLLSKKCGDTAENGEVLARIFGNDSDKLAKAAELLNSAFAMSTEPAKATRLIADTIVT